MADNENTMTEEEAEEKAANANAGGEMSDNENNAAAAGENGIKSSIDEALDATSQEQQEAPQQNAQAASFRASVSTPQTPAGMDAAGSGLDLLMDINITLRAELGRTMKTIGEILKLSPGMLIELDRSSSEYVDIFINDKLLASGEVTVVDGHFAIKITKILSRAERIHNIV